MYSRLEWKEILKEAGLSSHQFYYPVPDKTMPQMIFSDRILKEVRSDFVALAPLYRLLRGYCDDVGK